MSDDGGGITLPYGENATHNVWLSPLFMTRSGLTYPFSDKATLDIGHENRMSSNISKNATQLYYFIGRTDNIDPSNANDRVVGRSLRCLVSTNNK